MRRGDPLGGDVSEEAAERSKASEESGQKAGTPRRLSHDLSRMRGTTGLQGVRLTRQYEGRSQ